MAPHHADADTSGSLPTFRYPLILILSVGAFLRLLRLGSKSLWFDEAHGFNIAQAGMDAFWNQGIEPVHPPLFFFLLELWSKLGTSEFTLRLLSALFSILALWLIYTFCLKLFDRPVALTISLLFALNPIIIWYAQELRNYSLLLILAAISSLALVNLVQSDHRLSQIGSFTLFVLATAGLAYTHYGAMFFLLFQITLVVLLTATKKLPLKSIWLWLIGFAFAIGLYYPWLTSPVGSSFYRRLFSGQRVANFPILYRPLPGFETPILELVQTAFPILVALVLLAPAALFFVARSPAVQNLVSQLAAKKSVRITVYTLLCLAIIAFVIPRAFTVKRHLVVFVPFALIPIGLMWPFRGKNIRWILPVLALSLVGSLINIFLVPKTDWRTLSAEIVSQARPGDVILINPSYLIHPSSFYVSEAVEHGPTSYSQQIEILTAENIADYNRIWYIEQPINSDHQQNVQDGAFSQLEVISTSNFFRTDLYLLAPPSNN